MLKNKKNKNLDTKLEKLKYPLFLDNERKLTGEITLNFNNFNLKNYLFITGASDSNDYKNNILANYFLYNKTIFIDLRKSDSNKEHFTVLPYKEAIENILSGESVPKIPGVRYKEKNYLLKSNEHDTSQFPITLIRGLVSTDEFKFNFSIGKNYSVSHSGVEKIDEPENYVFNTRAAAVNSSASQFIRVILTKTIKQTNKHQSDIKTHIDEQKNSKINCKKTKTNNVIMHFQNFIKEQLGLQGVFMMQNTYINHHKNKKDAKYLQLNFMPGLISLLSLPSILDYSYSEDAEKLKKIKTYLSDLIIEIYKLKPFVLRVPDIDSKNLFEETVGALKYLTACVVLNNINHNRFNVQQKSLFRLTLHNYSEIIKKKHNNSKDNANQNTNTMSDDLDFLVSLTKSLSIVMDKWLISKDDADNVVKQGDLSLSNIAVPDLSNSSDSKFKDDSRIKLEHVKKEFDKEDIVYFNKPVNDIKKNVSKIFSFEKNYKDVNYNYISSFNDNKNKLIKKNEQIYMLKAKKEELEKKLYNKRVFKSKLIKISKNLKSKLNIFSFQSDPDPTNSYNAILSPKNKHKINNMPSSVSEKPNNRTQSWPVNPEKIVIESRRTRKNRAKSDNINKLK